MALAGLGKLRQPSHTSIQVAVNMIGYFGLAAPRRLLSCQIFDESEVLRSANVMNISNGHSV